MRRRMPGYGTHTIYEALRQRGQHAISTVDLRKIVNLEERSFLNAISWLVRRGEVFRWQGEGYQDYVVLTEFRHGAFYEVEVETPALCQFFGQPARAKVVRTVPFVLHPDTDEGQVRRNRYAELQTA